mgnify:CR=1 FL=1
MAIDFPNFPVNGQEYAASNGIVYTYDAATDTWTGGIGGEEYWGITSNGDLHPVSSNANVLIGGTTTSTAQIDLGSDGSGQFKSDITSNTRLTAKSISETEGLFIGQTADWNARIQGNGEAYFAEKVDIGGNTASPAISLNHSEGSAFFTGEVTINNYNLNALEDLP